ncbi:MAG: hypothetical protein ACT6RF_09980 [Allorhizobium sp.]|uniref:hypothetical protein n=1 Tax=Allorhizobium sp. TaxID=633478 RepID=UPI004033AB27
MPRDYNPDRIDAIVALLRTAAQQNQTISYPELHACYGTENTAQIYWTLEEAAERLASRDVCIYEALMRSAQGLPKVGFFEVYKNSRRTEYEAMVGRTAENELTTQQRRQLTDHMRRLVYQHAANA